MRYDSYRENKSHSDSIFPYNTYLCSIPYDFYEVPLHWHNEMEIIYIKKGRGTVSLDFASHYVEGGDIITVLPGQMHGIFQFEGDSMEYENIIFSTDMLISKIADSLGEEFFVPLLSGKLNFNHVITKDDYNYEAFSSCLDRADAVCTTFPRGYKLMLKSCLFEFLYAIACTADAAKPVKNNRNLDRVKEVVKYVETNYKNRMSIEEIADVCGFSSSHFMKFFKNMTGTSFVDYLNDYRLSMASRMLASSEDTVLVIASDCGYENLSYFNRIFKRKYGLTPTEFRKKLPKE